MATKIKAVKCPQCGSEKHEKIDEKRFRCKSCGTEFYIEDDDINININHRYQYEEKPTSPFSSYLNIGTKVGIAALLSPIIFILLIFFWIFSGNSNNSSRRSSVNEIKKDSIEVTDNRKKILMMEHNGKPCIFYLVNRNYSIGYNNENPNYINGAYVGFRDAISGQILTEQLLISEKDLRNHNISLITTMPEIRYFYQANRYFLIVSKRLVYEINAKKLTISNVSQSLFKGKDAMNTGISSINFINVDNGEGFEVHNNLAETYFYFPATNRLYTEEAYNYACELTPKQLNGEVKDTVYLDLQQENMSESTSHGGRLRIWEINAIFHNGDPQDFSFYNWINKSYGQSRGNRLVSAKPITNWFTGFNSKMLYRNKHYILITFRPTISEDANSVFQLRDRNGNILWTQVFDYQFNEISDAILCGDKFWIWGTRKDIDNYSSPRIYSFNLKDGKMEEHISIPYEYKIEAK